MALNPGIESERSGALRLGESGGEADAGSERDLAPVEELAPAPTQQLSIETVTALDQSCPYRGLEAFQERDRHLFFGRGELVERLLAHLRTSNLLFVLGASGSGKSSVVRAGLLPRHTQAMGARLRDFTLVPDADPFEALRRALLASGFTLPQTGLRLEPTPEAPLKLIGTLRREGVQWLIFVDQFEEIFTRCDAATRESFIAALLAIAHEPGNSLKLVLAMRADLLDRLSFFPGLAQAIEKNIALVTDLDPAELREAIEAPAARHGVAFEEGLVEEIIRDVQAQPGSLPLLQYTLRLLWQEEELTGGLLERRLNTATYRRLGGVEGALQKRAEEIHEDFGDGAFTKESARQKSVRRIFLRLVDFVGQEVNDTAWRPVRRREPVSIFGGEQEQAIVEALVEEKLLTRQGEGPEAKVEVAHEALFTSWDRLKLWIEEVRQAIFAKDLLAEHARRWHARRDESAAHEELLTGRSLADALERQRQGGFDLIGGLGELEAEYLQASVERRDRNARELASSRKREKVFERYAPEEPRYFLRRVLIAIAAVAVLLPLAAGIVLWVESLRRNTAPAKAEEHGAPLPAKTESAPPSAAPPVPVELVEAPTAPATANPQASRTEYLRGVSLLREGDAKGALRAFAAAVEADPASSVAAVRLISLLGQREWPRPGAAQARTAPALLAEPQKGPPGSGLTQPELLARAGEVAVWRSPKEGTVIKTAEGKRVRLEMPAKATLRSLELSADGKQGLLTAQRADARGAAPPARLFNTSDGKLLPDTMENCLWAGFAADRTQILSIYGANLSFWKAGGTGWKRTGRVLTHLGMTGAAVASRGGRIATRSSTGEVAIWEEGKEEALHRLQTDPLWNDAEFDPELPKPWEFNFRTPALNHDGRRLATAYGKTVVIYDTETGTPLCDPIRSAEYVKHLEFIDGHGAKLRASFRDGSSVMWKYGDLEAPLAPADAAALCRLARAVADDRWVEEAPKLAAAGRPAALQVAKLVDYFAREAAASQDVKPERAR